VALAAANEGISVLIPYQPAELPAKAFSDGFHLNRQGAELFTSRLGKELPQVLAKE
jgi:lysophospholipase L1-like esterase